LKKPMVRGIAASPAAAAPLAAASTGMRFLRPPSLLRRSSSVASVTAPAVRNSALLERACAIT
jgi:hypothetical protein